MTLTTDARDDYHIIEEDPNESRRQYDKERVLLNSSTQTERVKLRKVEVVETTDWAESRLFETLLNPTMQPSDQEKMLDLIIEQNI